jgi:hypothetical protein
MEYTTEARETIRESLALAAYHLAAVWDALRDIENELSTEVETGNEALQSIAADIDVPAAVPTIDDETLNAFLADLEEEEEEEQEL